MKKPQTTEVALTTQGTATQQQGTTSENNHALMIAKFITKCVCGGALQRLNATEQRKLDVRTRREYLVAQEKHAQRNNLRQPTIFAKRKEVMVPLSQEDRALALRLGKEAYPRRVNWNQPVADYATVVKDLNHGRYSSSCWFTRMSYTPCLKSVAILSRWGDQNIFYKHHESSYFFRAPRGWYWDVDLNGLRLVSRSNPKHDFHVESDDLKHGSNHLRRQAVALRTKRCMAEKKARTERSLLLKHARGVRVGLQDSIDAGNCKAGSLEFAKRHGLSPNKKYSPARLLKLEPENARVKLAIAIAVRRHTHRKSAGTATCTAGNQSPNNETPNN